MRPRIAATAATAAAAFALVGLAGACSEQQSAAPRVHTSRTVEFASLKQAARAAEAVVEIAVDEAGDVEKVGAVPFTVTEARVVRVVRGSFDATTIRLRQLGSAHEDGLVPEGDMLEAGKRYVAMVIPFTFADFRPTGQHVVVGGWQGLYRVDGDMLVATDAASTALPRELPRARFEAEVTAP